MLTAPAGIRARGTGRGTEGHSSAACCIPLVLKLLCASRALECSANFKLEIWPIEEKIRNPYMPSPQKKKIQEDACCEINWIRCSNNWILNENFICSKCFSSPPSHCIIPAAPRCVPWAEPDHPGARCHLHAEILARCLVCGTAFEFDLWSEPNIGNAGAAFKQSNLYHLWFQTSSTFALQIQI